ncbi:hypothetical protein [Nocardia macrotermitis]|uniref:Uncharacterized protein n=1 Tax=Nocardia macrotermitis TaxID=2585198 RepID=A0A7K0D4U8_9NOCA|nr:hypothetical protein [Nocardia macrotermitis]MQY20748.1 hypothetical protein [Nocardia macrotermitis]
MSRDLPLDADAEEPGDHAGDTAYRVATGVARVARAGAYVTGGALVAEGSATPRNNESHDASRIAGWSLQDPQPNAPSPVVTYPDPAPDSVPPVLGHPGAAASDHPLLAFPNLPPGFEFHVHIETGPDAGAEQPDLSKIPGMNSFPGSDGNTPGLSVVPGPSVGSGTGTGTDHLPGTGNVPGLGNGMPGLGNGVPGLGDGIPGLGNGIPGLGNTPGNGDSPFELPSVPSIPDVPAMPSVPSVPEFQIPKLNTGQGGLPGLHPAAAPIAMDSGQGGPGVTLASLVHPVSADGFGPIDLGDAATPVADSGADFGPLGSENDALHVVSGFEGVGSAELSIYADVQVHLDAHAGLDGVWLNMSAQAAGGVVGGIGEQIDTYGQWFGGQSAPATAPGPEPTLGRDMHGHPHGIRSGMGVSGAGGHGSEHGTPAGVPAPGIAAPGVVMPVNVVNPVAAPVVPATAALSSTVAGPTVPTSVSVAPPAAVSAPTAVTAPAVATSVATAPQPATVVIASPPMPQPVVTTPLQPAAHTDPAVHALAGALPDHLGPIPLGAGAVVGPAAFLGLTKPAPAAATPPHTVPGGQHGGSVETAVPQPLTGPFDHSPIPHVSIPPIPLTGGLVPSHGPQPTPAHGPTAGPSHTYGPSVRPTPADDHGPTSTIAVHPNPTFSDDSTTDPHSVPTTVEPSVPAHPGSGTATTVQPGHGSSTPTRDSTPTHDSTPTYAPQPTHGPTSTYDSGPTRQPLPTHDAPPTHQLPTHELPTREPSLPTQAPSIPTHVPTVPTMPGNDAPSGGTVPHLPGGGYGGPGMNTEPHSPTLPQLTMSPHLPTKPIAEVHDSSAYAPWPDAGHAGLSAVPTGLSGGLLPGTETHPVHLPLHPAPDLHIAL